MRTLLTLAALIAAAPAVAEPAQQRITHEGRTYVYTVRQAGDRQVIDGRAYPAGGNFHLVVRGDAVTGMAGGIPVAFSISSAAGAIGAVAVAAR